MYANNFEFNWIGVNAIFCSFIAMDSIAFCSNCSGFEYLGYYKMTLTPVKTKVWSQVYGQIFSQVRYQVQGQVWAKVQSKIKELI